MFCYCINNVVGLKDSNGMEPEGAFDLEHTTYFLPDEQLSPEDKFFNENYLMQIAYYLIDSKNYAYSRDFTHRWALYDVCGNALLEAGEVDCSHLMEDVTGYGSKTARYRYDERLGKTGRLTKNGKLLDVELKQGMEVFKRSGGKEQGHVGMLILYDFGNGLEWAVFQSASMRITKTKALYPNDENYGPNITALIGKDGKCSWLYYMDPYAK